MGLTGEYFHPWRQCFHPIACICSSEEAEAAKLAPSKELRCCGDGGQASLRVGVAASAQRHWAECPPSALLVVLFFIVPFSICMSLLLWICDVW